MSSSKNFVKNHNKTSSVLNFGCRLNLYETEVMKQMLVDEKIENVAIFNTCGVTKEAEREAKQKIRKMKKENPNVKIVVTGCASQINPSKFIKMNEVDFVLGNAVKTDVDVFKNLKSMIHASNKMIEGPSQNKNPENIETISQDISSEIMKYEGMNLNEKSLMPNIMKKKTESLDTEITNFENHTRAFLRVQNGCDHRCTFCIIPYGRGNSRSVSIRDVLKQCAALVDNNYREIVLTGVDLTSYGKDFEEKTNLATLCKSILKTFPTLPRLRLSSVDVAEVDQDLFDLLVKESRIMPYLHISAQSGDDTILKYMKRRHKRNDVIEFCNSIRKQRECFTFGSDIITGFPTETDIQFQNTSDMLRDANMIFNHIFTFSPREGTFAASMKDQIPIHIRKERTNILISQTKKQLMSYVLSLIGTFHKAIIENDGMARCENFVYVKISNIEDFANVEQLEGKIAEIEITQCNQTTAIGRIVFIYN